MKDENAQLERLSLLVDLQAKRALERLASCYGVTQRAMLERFREWCLAMISPELCGTLFPRLRATLRVHDQLETPSTITLKQASMIAEIRRRE